jgi:hypothetical protein
MGKQFISISCQKRIYRLFKQDANKIYYVKHENVPKIPIYEKKISFKRLYSGEKTDIEG